MLTKGTFISEKIANEEADPKYLLCLRTSQNNSLEIGFSLLDSSTNQISLGYINDDENYTSFKTMLFQVKPIEILFDSSNINSVLLKNFKKNSLFSAVLSVLTNKENKWHSGIVINHLEKFYGEESKKWPIVINDLFNDYNKKELILSSLAGLYSYLEKALIFENIGNFFIFLSYKI